MKNILRVKIVFLQVASGASQCNEKNGCDTECTPSQLDGSHVEKSEAIDAPFIEEKQLKQDDKVRPRRKCCVLQ